MRFTIEQRFAADVDRGRRGPTPTPSLYEAMVGLAKLSPPGGGGPRRGRRLVHLEVRYGFAGDLSPAARAVIDPARLTWVEHSTHDLAAAAHRVHDGPRPLPRSVPVRGLVPLRADRRRGRAPGTARPTSRVKALLVGPRRRGSDRLRAAGAPGGRGAGGRGVRAAAPEAVAPRGDLPPLALGLEVGELAGRIEMNRPSASAHSRSPAHSSPLVKIFRPSTRSSQPTKRSSVSSGVGLR